MQPETQFLCMAMQTGKLFSLAYPRGPLPSRLPHLGVYNTTDHRSPPAESSQTQGPVQVRLGGRARPDSGVGPGQTRGSGQVGFGGSFTGYEPKIEVPSLI